MKDILTKITKQRIVSQKTMQLNRAMIKNHLEEGSALIIDKKPPRLRGEDEYQSFTIRVSKELEETLSSIAYRTMRSRNDVVNILLEHAIKEVVIPDD